MEKCELVARSAQMHEGYTDEQRRAVLAGPAKYLLDTAVARPQVLELLSRMQTIFDKRKQDVLIYGYLNQAEDYQYVRIHEWSLIEETRDALRELTGSDDLFVRNAQQFVNKMSIESRELYENGADIELRVGWLRMLRRPPP